MRRQLKPGLLFPYARIAHEKGPGYEARLNSALEHSLKPDQLVDALAIALAICKSWILSINAGI